MEKRNLTRSLLKKGLLSLFAFLLVGSALQAQTVATSTALPLPVSNVDPPVVLDFPVAAINAGNNSVEVTLELDHTWSSDLTITLIDPSGNAVTLVDGEGGNPDILPGSMITFSPLSLNPNTNFGADFDFDGVADCPAPGMPCDILPADDLGCLLVTQGAWTVTVVDGVGGDAGNVTAASITFVNDPNQAPVANYIFDNPPIEVNPATVPAPYSNTSPNSVEFIVNGETNEGTLRLDLNMAHTWVGDVQATLVAPNGAGSIQIFNNNGGAADFIPGQIVTVTDCAADGTDAGVCGGGCELSATGGNLALFTQSVVAINGSVNGTWTLNFFDTVGGDDGTVFAGSTITFGRFDCTPGGPLGVPTMSEWGLFLFFLVTMNLGLVFMYKMEAQKDLVLAGGNASVSFTNNLPFEMNAFQAAMKHALGLAVVGFAFILVVWGTIVPMDLIGMAIAIPMVAYTLQMVKLLKK